MYPTTTHASFGYWQPLAAAAAGLASWLADDFVFGSNLVTFLVGTLLVPLLAGILVTRVTRRLTAGLLAVLATLGFAEFEYFRLVLESVSFSAASVLVVVITLLEFQRGGRFANLGLLFGGVAAALMSLSRGEGVAIVAICSILYLLVERPRPRVLLRMWPLLIGFGFIYGPWVVRNLLVFGGVSSEGASSAPLLTHYQQWSEFPPAVIFDLGSAIDVRIFSLRRLCSAAVIEQPFYFVGFCAAVLLAVFARESQARQLARMVVGILAAFVLAGLAAAPAITLWNFRSSATYAPLIVCIALVFVWERRLLRSRFLGTVVGLVLAILLVAACVPQLFVVDQSLNWQAHNVSEKAAATLQVSDIVATNAAAPLAVFHAGGVVRVPSNGEAAFWVAARHYEITKLLIYRDGLTWSQPWVKSLYAERDPSALHDSGFRPGVETAEFRVFLVVNSKRLSER